MYFQKTNFLKTFDDRIGIFFYTSSRHITLEIHFRIMANIAFLD